MKIDNTTQRSFINNSFTSCEHTSTCGVIALQDKTCEHARICTEEMRGRSFSSATSIAVHCEIAIQRNKTNNTGENPTLCGFLSQ